MSNVPGNNLSGILIKRIEIFNEKSLFKFFDKKIIHIPCTVN